MSPTDASSACHESPAARLCWSGSGPFAADCQPISSSIETRRMPGSFIDTNVLVYLASSDVSKADRAEQVVAGGGVISVQVLNELTNVAQRKMRLSWAETRSLLATVRALVSVNAVTVGTHDVGVSLAERYGLSIYDAMIVAS